MARLIALAAFAAGAAWAQVTITTTSPLPTATIGVSYTQNLTASGGVAPYQWAVTAGILPNGLTLSTGGAITGTPLSSAVTETFTVQVTDSTTPTPLTASMSFTLPILTITTTSPLPVGTVNADYAEAVVATGGSGTLTWSVSAGTLPAGLTLNSSTGVILGEPTTAGPSNFTIQVTDTNQGTVTQGFALTINPALVITTSSPLPVGTVGVNYSETLVATGGSGTYSWSVSVGSLPANLTLNSTTGAITGQPTTAATSSFTISVTDTNSVTATKAFALTINPGLSITTSSPLPAGAVNSNYSQTLVATGGSGTYTWSVSLGSLPAGLTLNSTTGAITGQPTTAATSNFTIEVTDTNSDIATKAFALTVNPALLITTTSPLPAATAGATYSQTFAASGGAGGYTWSATGLPTWLSLTMAGVLSGVPPPLTAVNATFMVKVTDSSGNTTSGSFTVPVTLAITTASPLPAGTAGVNYSQTLVAVGGSGTYTWTVSVGSLPASLTLTAATGAITGQPTIATTANFTIQVTDSNQVTANKAFALTINPALVITTASPLPTGTAGVNYSQTLAATGGSGTYTWTVSAGSLPGGLTLNAGTGAITGQPTTNATSNFTIQVTDTNNATATKVFALTVNSGLAITTTSPLPAATVGIGYSETFAASGGAGGYTWSATGLPAWLNLTTAGVLSGTPPSTAVNATFTVKVTDSSGNTNSGSFIVPVTLAITTTSPLPPGTAGVSYSQSLVASGGSGSYTWMVSAGSLPAGLTLNSATGAISGQPTTAATANFTIQVTDTNKATATKAFALTIDAPLSITTSSPLANGVVGAAYNQTLAETGGAAPYTWSVTTGALPGGLTLAASTGVISGQPNATGTFSFTIQLSDSTIPTNIVTKQFVITIASFTITTAPILPNATVGVHYSQTLVAAGGVPPYVSWAITSGSLPAPLSLNSSTGAITGTPSAAGSASFTVTVTDSASNTAKQTFTLTIVTPPVISTPSLPNGVAGVIYSQTLAGSGGTSPYQWTVLSGSLPGGLSLSTAGTISGTPTAAGTFNFTIQLADATGVTASRAFTLTIAVGLTISTASPLPTGEVALAYSHTLAASGGASPYTWSITGGALPPGLTLSASGSLTGTPSTAGTFNFTVQATDSNKITASAALAVTIAGALSISTPAALDGGSLNTSYSQALAASGGVGSYKWAITIGPLPPGLSLSTAGTIAGVPTATGTFPFTAKVTDSLGATASRAFTIVIATGLTVATPATLPGAAVGVPYSESLQAAGGTPPYTWSTPTGSPPEGLSVSANGSIAGDPTVTGTFSFTVQVTDSLGRQASEKLSITVAPALSITTSTLPGGTVGGAYSQSFAATGGTPPYTWSLANGSLPGGLTLSSSGSIAGTATTAGTFSFAIKVTDSAALIATKQFSITVTGGISITTAAALPNAFINATYSQTLAAAGGTPPYKWAVTAGSLPAGLTLSPAGAITGAPSTAGSFQFTVTLTDSASGTASQQFTLIVGGALAISTTTLPGGKVGAPYSQTLTAAGGIPPYTFATTTGSLPPGITLNGAVLSGTPTKTGSYPFTVQVTDSTSATASEHFTVVIGGVIITTAAVPIAAVGTAYSYTLSASGTAPYTWAIQGTLPSGLTLDASTGVISGTPTAAGSSSVTIQVTDSTKATASAAFTLTVISATFTGLSSTATSAQQLSGALTLGAAYPQEISGQVTLAFQPDASLASPAADPSIQFSTGGTTASFSIPANSTAPMPFSLQTGTVAGTITLTVSWQAGGAALATPAALTQTIQIAPAVPVISAVTATTSSSGFQVVVTGYSNTRELTQAVLQFAPAAGQTLQTTSLTVSLASAATTWFQGSASDQYGGQFTLTLPFTVSDGSASAIGSISVVLVNTQGTSSSASATL